MRRARLSPGRAAIRRTPARTARTSPTSSPATGASRAPRSVSPRVRTSCSSTSRAPQLGELGEPRRFGRPARRARLHAAAGGRPAVRAAPERGQDRRATSRRHARSSARWTRCSAEPGIVLVQSVGNYANAAMHTHARVGPDQRHVLDWITPENDRTPNELEIWYSGEDVFDVTLIAPDGREFSVAARQRACSSRDGASVWGNFYHRLHEPNSGLNHVVIYLYTDGAERTMAGRRCTAARSWTGGCTPGSSATPAAAINRGSRERRRRRATRPTRSATASARSPWAPTTRTQPRRPPTRVQQPRPDRRRPAEAGDRRARLQDPGGALDAARRLARRAAALREVGNEHGGAVGVGNGGAHVCRRGTAADDSRNPPRAHRHAPIRIRVRRAEPRRNSVTATSIPRRRSPRRAASGSRSGRVPPQRPLPTSTSRRHCRKRLDARLTGSKTRRKLR